MIGRTAAIVDLYGVVGPSLRWRRNQNQRTCVGQLDSEYCPKSRSARCSHSNQLCYSRGVSTFEREFNSAVEAVERDVFINLVCENPQLTLAELTRLGKGKFAGLLGTVSVGDIIEAGGSPTNGVADDLQARSSKPGKAKPFNGTTSALANGKGKPAKAKQVNTRTPEGRRAYDLAVLAVVEAADRPIKAPEITTRVGGTALQVRKSLARLIEGNQVTWEGKARGMRYSGV